MPTLTIPARNEYFELVKQFPLTSIRDEKALKVAQQFIDKILRLPKLKAGALAYLDALSDLVLAYESTHHVIPAPSDADLLLHLMEARGISQIELHRETKIALSTISEVLSGKRRFTKPMIAKLSAHFRVEKGLFAANF
jgi:HTH-type transcriptional regulator/antitoxin HigA